MGSEEVNTIKPAQRATRKIRTASLVSSLTKGWQRWASEHSTKQEQEPAGWTPTSDEIIEEKLKLKWEPKAKIAVAPEGIRGLQDCSDSQIKTKVVTKTVSSSIHEKGRDIGSITEKYEKEQSSLNNELTIDKILHSNVSPTRRRKCSNLVSQLTKGWKEMEKDGEELISVSGHAPTLTECRSDSLETEDSGYGDGEGDAKPNLDKEKEDDGSDNDAARIKRSSSSLSNKAAANLNNINKAYKRYSPVNNIKGKWEKWSDQHILSQKLNPFSDEFDQEFAMSTRLQKGDEGYGHPKEGTKTAERAMRAEAHIHREMRDLCFIIGTLAQPGKDGKVRVTFGELFDRYVRISDKVVGILLRARKHGMVDFPGEMLWQGRDDYVIITLL
ncbi:actin-binding Rho-activating protein [Bombina bombina]|uniref:actin-binding Rho-activating protein n=1 Tax=Bombina bombina TaxID=8345 RepID=UPI00235B27BB|nr:actin-binding Rho-activating protein [Bombina bombina]